MMMVVQKAYSRGRSGMKAAARVTLLVVGFVAIFFGHIPKMPRTNGLFGTGIAHADAPAGYTGSCGCACGACNQCCLSCSK